MLDKQKATTNQLMDWHDTGAIDFCTVDKLTTEMSNVFRYYALIWILLLPLVSMSKNANAQTRRGHFFGHSMGPKFIYLAYVFDGDGGGVGISFSA